jgi:hypothetical protein
VLARGSGRGVDGDWLAWFEDDSDQWIAGFTLAGIVWALMGHNVAHEEIPTWIEEWAVRVGG